MLGPKRSKRPGPVVLQTIVPIVPRSQINSETTAVFDDASPIFRFGPFEADFERGELRKHGMKIRIEDKPFQILEILLKKPGRLITRKELQAVLWPDTFVSYEHSLNTAINKLRAALGDSSRMFRFVETVRRRGYRFVGVIERRLDSISKNRRRTLLVLPFRSQSLGRFVASFCDGLTEEISAQIGKLDPERLVLVSTTTALPDRQANPATDQSGRELGVDFFMEGSVRHHANRVRVSIHLARNSDRIQLWSEIYDRTAIDPLACQIEIAREVALALADRLRLSQSGSPRLALSAPTLPPALRIRKIGS